MAQDDDIRAGRQAYSARRWAEAYTLLSANDDLARLDARDVERLGDAAYLLAREDEAVRLWTRAHNAHVDRGDIGRAARVGFFLSLTCLLRGEASQSNGWLARTRRLLETAPECRSEQQLPRLLVAMRQMFAGDPAQALPGFDAAVATGTEAQDPDLLALALLSRGQALVAIGRAAEGAACLDEAMVSVTGGQVSPILSGIIYCAVILTCQSIFDSERAREWTTAFDAWCRRQSDLVPYRGQCLIHRSEILQMHGDWQGAMKAADRACRWLADRSGMTVGRAHYQKGELHRLLGDNETADQCYERALLHGVDPQPGRALLLLSAGQAKAAAVAIRSACGCNYDGSAVGRDPERIKLLGPSVEICLSAGETDTAVAAAEELSGWAAAFETRLLRATSAQATGTVLAATGEPEAALAQLSDSLALWQHLAMPYETACARIRLAGVCLALGDQGSADAHRLAARATLGNLGATSDPVRFADPACSRAARSAAGITGRQIDVLRLLAGGRTNRQIAEALCISEHTVARHMSNIFDKTGVSSRAAAVAFAHRNGLLS